MRSNITTIGTPSGSSKSSGGGSMDTSAIQKMIDAAISKTDSSKAVREKVAEILRNKVGNEATYELIETITEDCERVVQMAVDFGVNVENLTLRQIVDQLAAATGDKPIISIECNGEAWSIEDWRAYIAEHNEQPGVVEGIGVRTPFQEFLVGCHDVAGAQWGAYGVIVPNVISSQTGTFLNALQNSLVFEGALGTIQVVKFADPELVPGFAKVFATFADLQAYDSPLELADECMYVVEADETDGGNRNMYYYDGSQLVKRGKCPYYDTQKITGAPAAKAAWTYKTADPNRQWFLPTINHLLIISVYRDEINEARNAIGGDVLPTGNCWSCQQNAATSAYCVTLSTGAVSSTGKTNSSAVVRVAAL